MSIYVTTLSNKIEHTKRMFYLLRIDFLLKTIQNFSLQFEATGKMVKIILKASHILRYPPFARYSIYKDH